jgi:hypothetical protein
MRALLVFVLAWSCASSCAGASPLPAALSPVLSACFPSGAARADAEALARVVVGGASDEEEDDGASPRSTLVIAADEETASRAARLLAAASGVRPGSALTLPLPSFRLGVFPPATLDAIHGAASAAAAAAPAPASSTPGSAPARATVILTGAEALTGSSALAADVVGRVLERGALLDTPSGPLPSGSLALYIVAGGAGDAAAGDTFDADAAVQWLRGRWESAYAAWRAEEAEGEAAQAQAHSRGGSGRQQPGQRVLSFDALFGRLYQRVVRVRRGGDGEEMEASKDACAAALEKVVAAGAPHRSSSSSPYPDHGVGSRNSILALGLILFDIIYLLLLAPSPVRAKRVNAAAAGAKRLPSGAGATVKGAGGPAEANGTRPAASPPTRAVHPATTSTIPAKRRNSLAAQDAAWGGGTSTSVSTSSASAATRTPSLTAGAGVDVERQGSQGGMPRRRATPPGKTR